jgi:O-antigen/teichoic acid export membrane protein
MLAVTLSSVALVLASQASAWLLPELAMYRARGDNEEMWRLYRSSIKWISWLTLPAAALVVALSPLLVWIVGLDGEARDFFLDIFPFAIGSAVLAALGSPAVAWHIASGRYGLIAKVNLIIMTVLGVSLAFVRPSFDYGLMAAIAVAISTTVVTTWVISAVAPPMEGRRRVYAMWRTHGGVSLTVAALLLYALVVLS